MEDSILGFDEMPSQKKEAVSKGILARFDHPIFGVFIGSWLVINWKIVYWVLCGIKDPGATIDVIIKNYVNLCWDNFFNLLVMPLIATIGYLYYGPKLQETYASYKKKVALDKSGQSPVPKLELDKALKEADIYRAAYNVVNSQPVNWGRGTMPAEQFVKNYSRIETAYLQYEKENIELKRIVFENEKELARLNVELLESKKNL